MLHGLRWQLLALFVATTLFAISLAVRVLDTTTEVSATSTQASAVNDAPTVPPTPVATVDIPTLVASVPTQEIVTFREGLVGNVQRLNPLLADFNSADSDITSLIFEGLTGINQYGEIVPVLAEDWVVSSDGLEYMVSLRNDVLWQDGIPFTAADVAYTMSLLGSPDFPGPEDIGAFWSTVEVELINDHLVRFRLVQQLASFPEAMRIGILPYHAMQGTLAAQLPAHPFNLSPIGTGPYQLEALRTNGDQILEVNLRVAPVYRQRSEGASGIGMERFSFRLYDTFEDVLQAFSTGEIDAYSTADPNERLALLGLPDSLAVHTTFAPKVGILIFNWVDDDLIVFRELRVRQALARGLDRSSIIERHMLNTAVLANSPLPVLSWAYDYGEGETVWPGYDQPGARDLLSTIRVDTESSDDSDGQSGSDTLLEFAILTINDPALVSVVQEIAVQWEQLNLQVNVEAVDGVTFQSRLESAEFDVALVELSVDGSADPDVYTFWHQGQYPDGKNYGGANDRAISEALERARRDDNGLHRVGYYHDFQREFVTRAISIPLYYPLYSYFVDSSVSGIQLGFLSSPADRFLTIAAWH